MESRATHNHTRRALGEGSLQLFVLADFEHHYFTIRQIDSLGLPVAKGSVLLTS